MKKRPRHVIRLVFASLLAMAAALSMQAVAAETPVRVAYIDPLSGPFAAAGQGMLHAFEYSAQEINADGGILGRQLQIVPFDNKSSAQASVRILGQVAGRGIHYITQGNGSHVAAALVAAVNKHNRRHPDDKIVYLNFAAVAPALTHAKCSFWHFRFDAGSAMKLNVLTDFIAANDAFDKVFLINQDYSHGQYIAAAVPKLLQQKAPDVDIVGSILHPVGKVRDFAPYVAKIAESGADVVVTGNWGPDLSLLIHAGEQAGLDVKWLTYYGNTVGMPKAIGSAADGDVFVVSEWHENLAVTEDLPHMAQFDAGFAKRHDLDFYMLRVRTELQLLKKAMETAGSSDPQAVAYALEDLSIATPTGTATLRAEDHQLLQPLYISRFSSDYAKYDAEDTGLGWVTVEKIAAAQTALPARCDMQRP